MKTKAFIITALAAGALAMMGKATLPQEGTRLKARHYLMNGYQAEIEGRSDEAFELYKKAYRTDPGYEEASFYYGLAQMSLNNDSLYSEARFDTTKAAMRRFVERYPDNISESQLYARVAGALGDLDETIRVYEQIARLHPEKTRVLLMLADAYTDNGDLKKALRTLERFEEAEGMSPQLSLQKIYYRLSEQDTVGAIAEATALIESSPTNAEYHLLKGQVYSALAMPDSAMRYFQKAEQLEPDNGRAKLSIANIYKERGDSVAYDEKVYQSLLAEDLAVEQKVSLLAQYLQVLIDDKSDTSRGDYLFAALRDQYPHEPTVLELAARYESAKKNYAKAIEAVEYAIDLDGDNQSLWKLLMSNQILADRYEDAYATYEKSKKVFSSSDMDMMYGSAASLNKDYSRAVEVYEGLLKSVLPGLEATDAVMQAEGIDKLSYEDLMALAYYYNVLGDVCHEAGDNTMCYRAYDNALALFPKMASVLNNYAYFLTLDDGDMDKALRMSTEAVAQDPDNPTYLDTHAWVLYKKGRYAEALEVQRKALEIADDEGDESEELREHLEKILEAAGEKQDVN